MLVMVEFEVGLGRTGKDGGEKNQLCIDCSIAGGCFFGCVVDS